MTNGCSPRNLTITLPLSCSFHPTPSACSPATQRKPSRNVAASPVCSRSDRQRLRASPLLYPAPHSAGSPFSVRPGAAIPSFLLASLNLLSKRERSSPSPCHPFPSPPKGPLRFLWHTQLVRPLHVSPLFSCYPCRGCLVLFPPFFVHPPSTHAQFVLRHYYASRGAQVLVTRVSEKRPRSPSFPPASPVSVFLPPHPHFFSSLPPAWPFCSRVAVLFPFQNPAQLLPLLSCSLLSLCFDTYGGVSRVYAVSVPEEECRRDRKGKVRHSGRV